ncbi:MBL fold metallo-hydrolase [Haloglomus litoreum]|uniref:MBL fold metallo-hydrolase n=1 Tax=Haloglomus litoreum TaxID=3034026 RepID=UPI0023E865C1|nr:MBL fold metallo-hydrolase [Haloglomus sp. DT116]
MTVGDVEPVEAVPDCYYVDTGMYGTEKYGAVYIFDTEHPTMLDTGMGTNHDLLLDALDELGIAREDLAQLVPTHVHLDHAGGAGFLAEACPNAEVLIHERGARHIIDPERLWEGTKAAVGEAIEFYTEPEPVPDSRVTPLVDGDTVDLGDRELDVHEAPGHAPHQHVFHDAEAEAVFVADAAGIYVPQLDAVEPTSPPANFDFEGCIEDVRLLQRLDPETLCYAHFGPAPADGKLVEYADVLTDWVEAVAEARVELDDDEAVVEHFVEQTEMDAVWSDAKARTETAMNVRGVLGYLDRREAAAEK